jgi:hypothetical protein
MSDFILTQCSNSCGNDLSFKTKNLISKSTGEMTFKPTKREQSTKSLKHTGKSLSDYMKPEGEYSLKITKKNSQPLRTAKRLTASAIPPKSASVLTRHKANTISQCVHISNDGVKVSVNVIINCLSRAVWYEIKNNDTDRGTQVDAFVEDPDLPIPQMSVVEDFFAEIFKCKDLSTECAVTAAAYVDKLKIISGVKVNRTNWRRVCFIAVLGADKVLRDKLVWNEDYKDIHLGIDLVLLRKMERAFLRYIEYSLNLTQAEYAIYLFDLLSLREKQDIPEKVKTEGNRLRSSSEDAKSNT